MIPTTEVREYIKMMYLKHYGEVEPQAGDTALRKWLKIDDPDHKHQFITIALPNTLGIMELKKKIYSLNYKYLGGARLRVENFSESGNNLHIHILKEGVYSKTRVIRDMARKFKVEPNFVNVKHGKSESDWQNRLNYIKGLKADENKSANVQKDHEWREENGIEHIYIL